jgi:hypothetical protein
MIYLNTSYIYLIIGLIFSYIYSIFFLPKNSGECPNICLTIYPFLYKSMLIIPFNKKKALHIHHWIIYLFICCLLYFYFTINNILFGFSLGLLVQGLSYNDSFNILCSNPY